MTTPAKPLTSAELADLKARAKAATPGKWVVYNETDVWTEDNRYITTTDIGDVTEFEKNNTEHIAAANPEAILRLIDMIERRNGVLKKLEEALIAGGSELMSNRQRLIDLVREALAATEPHSNREARHE